MSYRSRLTLFFVLIVIVPMAAVAVLVVRLSSESRTGKADAHLAANVQTALAVYRDDRAASSRHAAAVAKDGGLQKALRGHDRAALRRAVARLAREQHLVLLSAADPNGTKLAESVNGTAVASEQLVLRGGSAPLATLTASSTAAAAYLRQVKSLTGAESILNRNGSRLLATSEIDTVPSDARRRTAPLEPGLSLVVLNPRPAAGVLNSQPLLITVLVLFFALAMTLILPLLRDLQRLHGVVEEQAVTDELTGLANQRGFRRLIEKEVERAKRFERPVSLLMLDIDDFKGINDTYGHPQGDQVLSEVARMLRDESRTIDEPARYGGEEFALTLPETDAAGAFELAERVRKRIESTPIALSGSTRVDVRVSVGVAGTPGTEADASALVSAADGALYEAKRAGKNRTAVAAESRKTAPEPAPGT